MQKASVLLLMVITVWSSFSFGYGDTISPDAVASVMQKYADNAFNASNGSGFKIIDISSGNNSVTFTVYKQAGANASFKCWDHEADEGDPNFYNWASGSFTITVPGPFTTFEAADIQTIYIQSAIGTVRQTQPWLDIYFNHRGFNLSTSDNGSKHLDCMQDGK